MSILDFLLPADSGNHSLALARALTISVNVFFPDGSYNFPTAVDYVQGMRLFGGSRCHSNGTGGVQITAPNGFVKNANTTRKQIVVMNMQIDGDGTAAALIDGPFGGDIDGVRFENTAAGAANGYAIRNASAYLLRIRHCAFDAGIGTAIALADPNGTEITNCWFDGDIECHIDNTTLTPQSGANFGSPLMLMNNNFNMSGTFANTIGGSSCKLRGALLILNNYWEDFSTGTSWAGKMLDITVGRFDGGTLTVMHNEMNGQGNAGTVAIYLNGTHSGTLRNICCGEISRNRIYGCTNEIEFGPNNYIPQLKIYDNGTPSTQPTIANANPRAIYRPIYAASFDTATSISGSTYVVLPLTEDISINNSEANTTATSFIARRTGYYRITAVVTVSSTANSYPSIDLQLWDQTNSAELCLSQGALVYASGTTYSQLTLNFIVNAEVDNQQFRLRMRNGQTALRGHFTAEFLGDGWY